MSITLHIPDDADYGDGNLTITKHKESLAGHNGFIRLEQGDDTILIPLHFAFNFLDALKDVMAGEFE